MRYTGWTGAVAVLGVVGALVVAPPAQAADRVDLPTPGPNAPAVALQLTDGAMYLAEWPYGWSGGTVTRRVLHQSATGTALGNAQRVGLVSYGPPWVVASDDAAIWTSESSFEVVRLPDGGSPVGVGDVPTVSIDSYGGSWFSAGDGLWPVPADRAGAVGGPLLGRGGTPPSPGDALHGRVLASAVSESVVVWIESWSTEFGWWRTTRLYANAIDPSGFVGEPVLVEEAVTDPATADGFVPYDEGLAASESRVVWLSLNTATEQTEARTISVADLGATPERLALTRVQSLALDGDRVALAQYDDVPEGQPATGHIVVRDLVSGTTELSIVARPETFDLHGDLLAWVDADFTGGFLDSQLHVVSVSGATDLSAVPQFTDVELSPFVPFIDRIAVDGITTGYPDGTFRPMTPVTREAMAAFLYRQAGEPAFTPPAVSPFDDVSPGHPFYAEICWLADAGISTGWAAPDGGAEFRPGTPVTREAMAAFLHRFAGSPTVDLPAASPFADVDAGHPFYAAIVWLAQTGISTGWAAPGGATFRPAAEIERQAMAAFLVRFDTLD